MSELRRFGLQAILGKCATFHDGREFRINWVELLKYFKFSRSEDPQATSEDSQATSEDVTSVPTKESYGYGTRHVQVFLWFFCISYRTFSMVNMSMAIIPMTDKNSSNPDFYEFDWDIEKRSSILSFFSFGFIFTQLFAGFLGQMASPTLLLLVSHLSATVLAALTPTAALYGGWRLLCALRALLGFSQGIINPSLYVLLSKWAPVTERNRFMSAMYCGVPMAGAAAMALCGFLASSSGGWPSIFYFTSAIGVVWCLLWFCLGADSPAVHPSISPKERDFIQNSLVHSSRRTNMKIPWKALFTSVPFLALMVTFASCGVGQNISGTEMPSYMNMAVGVNIETVGLISSLSYILMGVSMFLVGWSTDYITKKKLLSDNFIRKMWTTIALTGGHIALVLMGFVGNNVIAMIALYITSLSLQCFLGIFLNCIDLAPNFAGVMQGIAGACESCVVYFTSYIVGWVVHDSSSSEQWTILFIIAASVSIAGNLVFVIFGSTEVQSWNKIPEEEI